MCQGMLANLEFAMDRTRKSEQWEEERRGLDAQILRLTGPSSQMVLTGQMRWQ